MQFDLKLIFHVPLSLRFPVFSVNGGGPTLLYLIIPCSLSLIVEIEWQQS